MSYGVASSGRRGTAVDVSADSDGITTEERVTGYDGYTSTVWVPLSVLRALLASHGLHIVGAKEMAVLQAIERSEKRLGDDPVYYEVYGSDLEGLSDPESVAAAINAWLTGPRGVER